MSFRQGTIIILNGLLLGKKTYLLTSVILKMRFRQMSICQGLYQRGPTKKASSIRWKVAMEHLPFFQLFEISTIL